MAVGKHSITILGHRTSVSAEDEIWREFLAICARRGQSASQVAAELDSAGGKGGLSGKIRMLVFSELKKQ
jgi:predicted DNA-binding ribbon-helix-helix protein